MNGSADVQNVAVGNIHNLAVGNWGDIQEASKLAEAGKKDGG